MTPFSILDLAPVAEGSTVGETLARSLELAQQAETLGFHRYWLAEHHNMPGIGSAATSVVIGHIAAGTERIRVGSGGIMLPNHSPLVIAEQFGTLESLFPGRIDLGVGRAPGTDQLTVRALRRHPSSANTFPEDVKELRQLLGPARPGQAVVATPGEGTNVPIWMLGSSTFGARLAAQLGLPYAFASHFAPAQLMEALHVYRENFVPSGQLAQPHVMVSANVVVADTTEEAQFLFSTTKLAFARLARNERGKLPPPVADVDRLFTPMELMYGQQVLRRSFAGTQVEVRSGLDAFLRETGADEVIVCDYIFDHAKRLRSYQLLAEVVATL